MLLNQDREATEASSRAEKLKFVELLTENFRNMGSALSTRGVRQECQAFCRKFYKNSNKKPSNRS